MTTSDRVVSTRTGKTTTMLNAVIYLSKGGAMKPERFHAVPVVILALGVAISAFGQTQQIPKVRDPQRYIRNLVSSLRNDVPGIVESAIYDIIQYKSYYPAQDFRPVIGGLSDLAESGRDSALSFKANLALLYLRYGTSLDNDRAFQSDNHEYAFQLVSDQLTRKFLTTSNEP